MNLKNLLKNIFKPENRKKIIFFTVCIISIIAVITGFCIHSKNEAKRLEEQSKQEELLRKEQEKIEQMKNEYHQLCAEYNSAIDEYNDSTEKFNAFLEKIEPYALLNKTDPLEKRNYIDEDFETFRSNGADFSKISADTDNIRNDADKIESKRIELCELAYKSITDNYNLLAETYNNAVEITSVDYIEDIPKKAITKTYKESESEFDEDEIFKDIADISSDIDNLSENYQVVTQITNPDEKWVIDRLNKIETITGREAVNESNDPNALLGKEGGYTGCVYFMVNNVDQSSVTGNTVIEKGTDGGGAIEVYPNLESAKNRCDYLSQFDNTLLYSGSYVIIGTMVVRTSYKLSNQEQIELTDKIIKTFTTLTD